MFERQLFRRSLGPLLVVLQACATSSSTPASSTQRPGPQQPTVTVTTTNGPATTPANNATTTATSPRPSTTSPVPGPVTSATAPEATPPSIPESLGWPADTRIVRFTETAHIMSAADSKSAPLGKVMRGTKTAWTRFVDLTPPPAAPAQTTATTKGTNKKTRPPAKLKKCAIWVEIAPMGWVCQGSLAATKDSVGNADPQPVLERGDIMPGKYYVVKDGALAYSKAEDITANNPKPDPLEKTMLRGTGTTAVDGVSYAKTNKGLIESSLLRGLSPSDFAGIDLRKNPQNWPFAMISGGKRSAATVRAEPKAKAKKVGSQPWRAVVAMGTEQDGFVAIGENQWIVRSALRVFTKQVRPAAVAVDGQWIDVDLDEQTVVAYQGDTPIFASVVSTGRKAGTTPVGMYRVRSKAATMRMAGEPGTNEKYDVGEIPWAMRFKKGVFFHASYWHDGFGTKHSHGCVNLSPRDARFLYAWAGPAVPDGWTELEVAKDQGTIVRVRDAANPDPAWYAYTDEPTTQLDEADP